MSFIFDDISKYLEMGDIKTLSKVSNNAMYSSLDCIRRRMKNELLTKDIEVIVLILYKEYQTGEINCNIEGIYTNATSFKNIEYYLDAYKILASYYEDEKEEDGLTNLFLSALIVKLGDIILIRDVIDKLRSNIIISGKEGDMKEGDMKEENTVYLPESLIREVNRFEQNNGEYSKLTIEDLDSFVGVNVSGKNIGSIRFIPLDYMELFNDFNEEKINYTVSVDSLSDIMSDWAQDEMSFLDY